ncbi:MAG TPA: methyl-accepting chemotaxis protein [Bacillota bacterium]|nr:methyl-accepting chemotaxis protein [Bacillota bacterium]
MKSIRTTLIISFSIVLLVICSVMWYAASNRATAAVLNEGEKAASMVSQEASMLIRSFMDQKIILMEAIAAQKIVTDDTPWDEKVATLQPEAERNGYETFAIADLTGNAKRLKGDPVNIADRSYFKLALGGKSNVSDVLISKATNKPSIIIAVPIIREGTVRGVLYGVVDGTELSNITNQIKFGKSGYTYIANKSGTLMAHPDSEKVLTQYNPVEDAKNKPELQELADIMINKMAKGETGSDNYFFEGSRRTVNYTPIPDTEWSVAIAMQQDELLDDVRKLKMWMLILSAVVLLFGDIIIFIMSIYISKPIVDVSIYARKIAALDITQDIPAGLKKRKDELGVLANSFQLVTDNLRGFIKEISDASQHVASSSEELTATSQQVATSAEEVAKTIEEMAKGIGDQAKDTEIGSVKINEIGNIIDEEALQRQALNKAADEVVQLKDEGFKTLNELVVKTEASNKFTKEIYSVVLNTSESAKKIENASQMIQSIAGQTNLLALNAAIEAARAGEAGRGFAVVSDEIRKLAEDSNKFTNEIEEIVSELSGKVSDAVNAMQEAAVLSAAQTEGVEVTKTKFEGIAAAVEKTKEAIAVLNETGEAMNSKKNEIIDIIHNLSALSEENAAGTEEASASVEEQTASMEQIADASEELSKLAEDMQKSIAKFKF